MACRMIQSSCWAAIRVSDSGRESAMTRDMANLQWMRSEGACPWRANPPGDDGDGTGDERASTTADAMAVRVKGCDANGFRSTRTSRAAALKIDGYLGMSPATPAGMSRSEEHTSELQSPKDL